MTEIKIAIENSLWQNEKIAIIGTGNYGVSIGKRLLHYGYDVIYGSRNPNLEYLKDCFKDLHNNYALEVTSISDAWNRSNKIVILAISADSYENFVDNILDNLSHNSKSKILVEISNPINSKISKISNAENLDQSFKQKLLERKINYQVNIVKGFNLINAYSISSFITEPNKTSLTSADYVVPIAGNCSVSKKKVADLCSNIGLRANDTGLLNASRILESASKKTFDEWKYPSLISILYFFINIIWLFFHNYFFPKKPTPFNEYVKKFSIMTYVLKSSGFTALYLIAFVYFGSIVASIYQLIVKTKYKRFPKWLDNWLKSRKQFGLWAFMFATIHVILSLMSVNPQYVSSWFKKSDDNLFGKMTLNGELNTLTGVFAYILLLLVALSSINSIANSFNWSEWNFVQTKIGLSCLFVAALHSFVMFYRQFAELKSFDIVFILTRPKLIAVMFPVFVLILRFIFGYFGPLRRRIQNIRTGKLGDRTIKI